MMGKWWEMTAYSCQFPSDGLVSEREWEVIGPLPEDTPTKSDQIRPCLTKSNLVGPNPTESYQIQPNPTESTKSDRELNLTEI